MQRFTAICLVLGFSLGAGSEAALAARLPNFTPSFPIEHQTLARFAEEPNAPYAMTYMDDVARSLGIHGGRADFLDTGRSRDPLMPSVTGGIDRGGAMLRLQWHPGE